MKRKNRPPVSNSRFSPRFRVQPAIVSKRIEDFCLQRSSYTGKRGAILGMLFAIPQC